MSTKERRAELKAEREAQAIRDEEERARLASRTMWEKINDIQDIHDIKEILWEITGD